ncbi:MAG: DALR domain-containing protein [Patescibacteria group bacterium]|nr:DALR domain-containing protein [Patescibacteria group bacterium]
MLQYNADFLDAIADDLNTAQAIAVIWDLMKNYKAASLSSYQATAILDFIDTIVEVLGIEILSVEEETLVDQDIPQDIQDLAQQRWDAKQAKDYDLADSLRDQIQDQGFSVQEDAEGFQIFPIK